MSKLVYSMALAALLVLGLQGLALSAVTVTWTDALGPQSANLVWVPISPGDPLYIFSSYAWYGNLNISYDHMAPIDFTFTGDYTGDDQSAYPYILLHENVHNLTQVNWTDFHLHVPEADGDEFGWVQGFTTGWDVNQGLNDVSYTMGVGGSPVHPGETFYDGVFIFDDYDATADLTLTKWPTPLPEVGSAAVLLSGLGGLLAYVKRRRI